MSYKYKQELEYRVINKYIGNKNYEKDFYTELYESSPKTGDKEKDIENSINDFHEFERKREEVEETHPRYSSTEDISSLEFQDYSDCDWFNERKEEDKEPSLTLKRNFISDVEKSDLKEIMVTLGDYISENEDYPDPITDLKKCMKSLVRIVHRFDYTREHYSPVTETHQSRKSQTLWT